MKMLGLLTALLEKAETCKEVWSLHSNKYIATARMDACTGSLILFAKSKNLKSNNVALLH